MVVGDDIAGLGKSFVIGPLSMVAMIGKGLLMGLGISPPPESGTGRVTGDGFHGCCTVGDDGLSPAKISVSFWAVAPSISPLSRAS